MKKILVLLIVFCGFLTPCFGQNPEPHILVLFGATGDLAQRKLAPALAHMAQRGELPRSFICVGVGRKELTHQEFRRELFSKVKAEELKNFPDQFFYFTGDYEKLRSYLEQLDSSYQTKGNRIYYLSTPPSAFPTIIEQLHEHGLLSKSDRVVIEKPFGHDLPSAVKLQEQISQYLNEDQIYRMDHYLGKSVVQAILPLRKNHPNLEQLFNREHVSEVSIVLSEELGVGTRGQFMEESGLLRDVVQNHLMQLLALTAMDLPPQLDALDIQKQKERLIQSLTIASIFRGQYGRGTVQGKKVPGYREEAQVAPDSAVETYVAATLYVDNPRWQGVPFYLKAGKRLDRSYVAITLTLKDGRSILFRVQPNPSIFLAFQVYQSLSATPDAYECLLLDCMKGDQRWFVGIDELLESWRLFTPTLNAWKKTKPTDFPNYSAGSTGPECIKLERGIPLTLSTSSSNERL